MKSFSDKNAEQKFIDSLKSLEVKPPKDLWNDIEKTLHKRNRKKYLLYISYASAAVVTLFFIMETYLTTLKERPVEVAKSEQATQKRTIVNRKIENNLNPLQGKTSKGISVKNTSSEYQNKFITSNTDIDNSDNRTIAINELPKTYKTLQRINAVTINFDIQNETPFPKQQKKYASIANPPLTANKNVEWTLSATGFPVYAFHTAGVFNPDKNLQEVGLWAMGGSVTIRRSLRKNFAIETGLQYNPLGQQVKNTGIVQTDINSATYIAFSSSSNTWGTPVISSNELLSSSTNGTTSLWSLSDVQITQLLTYIEIPIIISKSMTFHHFSINLKSGLSAGFLVGNKVKVTSSYGSFDGKTEGVKPFLSSAILGVGISTPFVSKVNLVIEPTLRIGLYTLHSGDKKSYPFSTSIKLGMEIPL